MNVLEEELRLFFFALVFEQGDVLPDGVRVVVQTEDWSLCRSYAGDDWCDCLFHFKGH